MDAYTNIVNIIALTMGVAWASGINLYATILTLGPSQHHRPHGAASRPADSDRSPGDRGGRTDVHGGVCGRQDARACDTGWDSIHTFIRIPAGALLAAGAVGANEPGPGPCGRHSSAAAVAAGVHATKAGTRILINTSPEPFTNWIASSGRRRAMVVGGLWTALHHPLGFSRSAGSLW